MTSEQFSSGDALSASADTGLAAAIPSTLSPTLGETGPDSPTPLAPLPTRSPDPSAPGVRLSAPPLRTMLSVKADLGRPDVQALINQLVGVATLAPRTAHFRGETGVLWMAPDELLIMAPRAQAGPVATHLALALAETRHLIVDVSDMRSVIRLTGTGAREVLAKGAPVDLHPEQFGVGDLRRTRISTIAAAFYQTAAAPETFEIICFRSYAAALWAWLTEAAAPDAAPGVFPVG